MSDADISRDAGVDPFVACKWWRAQSWVNLVMRVAEARAAKGLPLVWEALERKAMTGDMRAIALYLQRHDGAFIQQTHPVAKTPEDKAKREAAQKAIRMATAKKPGPKSKAV